jgi:hypothetical protein
MILYNNEYCIHKTALCAVYTHCKILVFQLSVRQDHLHLLNSGNHKFLGACPHPSPVHDGVSIIIIVEKAI